MKRGAVKDYSLLVFDWDGTLVDSEGLAVKTIQKITTDLGYQMPPEETLRQYFGMGLEKIHQELFPQRDFAIFNKKFYNDFTEEKLATNFFEGAIETLKYLKQLGFTLAIATNKPRKKLEIALRLSNIKSLFSATRCPEDGGPKPQPDMLLTLLKELKYEPKDTLMIGDTAFDMQFASNARVDALAACYTHDKKKQLSQYHPVGFIENIKELKDIFNPEK